MMPLPGRDCGQNLLGQTEPAEASNARASTSVLKTQPTRVFSRPSTASFIHQVLKAQIADENSTSTLHDKVDKLTEEFKTLSQKLLSHDCHVDHSSDDADAGTLLRSVRMHRYDALDGASEDMHMHESLDGAAEDMHMHESLDDDQGCDVDDSHATDGRAEDADARSILMHMYDALCAAPGASNTHMPGAFDVPGAAAPGSSLIHIRDDQGAPEAPDVAFSAFGSADAPDGAPGSAKAPDVAPSAPGSADAAPDVAPSAPGSTKAPYVAPSASGSADAPDVAPSAPDCAPGSSLIYIPDGPDTYPYVTSLDVLSDIIMILDVSHGEEAYLKDIANALEDGSQIDIKGASALLSRILIAERSVKIMDGQIVSFHPGLLHMLLREAAMDTACFYSLFWHEVWARACQLPEDTYIVDPLFLQADSLENYVKHIDLKTFKLILFPLVKDFHWSLLVVNSEHVQVTQRKKKTPTMKRHLNASYFNSLGSSNTKLQLAVKAILRRVPSMRHMASLKWKHCTVPLQAPDSLDCAWFTLYYMLEVLFSSGENAVHQIFQHFDGIDKFQLHMLRSLLNTLTCDHCAGVSGLLAEEMD